MKECDNCYGKGTVDKMNCHTDSNECCGGLVGGLKNGKVFL